MSTLLSRHGYSTSGQSCIFRRSNYFIPIRAQKPKDAVNAGHKMLLEAGYIRQVASGFYNYLPICLRVLEKITKIIDQEMCRIGGQKMIISKISPKSLWDTTNRWETIGDELMHLTDRKGNKFCLTPTCEEVMTNILSAESLSPNQLPIKLYQIGEKYRDEMRPRSGLLRAREFIMKDMYSFDLSRDDAIRSYYEVMDAYHRIFQRLGVPYAVVLADAGFMSDGDINHEFHALSNSGEETMLHCPCKAYYCIPEMGFCKKPQNFSCPSFMPDSLNSVLSYSMEQQSPISVWVYNESALLIIDSRRNLKESSLKSIFEYTGQYSLRKLTEPLKEHFVALRPEKKKIVLDSSLNIDESLPADQMRWIMNLHEILLKESPLFFKVLDLTFTQKGDICLGPDRDGSCGDSKVMSECKGVEIGHLFYLGSKYTSKLNFTYTNVSQRQVPVEMGSYGIGVSRILSVIAESYSDEKGLRWPANLAPFQVTVATVRGYESVAEELVVRLQEQVGIPIDEIMLDDRNESIGLKVKQSNFIGIPYTIIVGKNQTDKNIVELEDYNGQKKCLNFLQLKTLMANKNSVL